MWSELWNKGRRVAPRVAHRAPLLLAALAVALAGCSSRPARPETSAPPARTATPAPAATAPATAAPASRAAPAARAAVPAAGGSGPGTPVGMPRPDVPPAARADFGRAVTHMRAGHALEAELGFKQVALLYPQFAAPLVNLALLERKDGKLEQAETTLKNAVAGESGSAVAWTELGVTQRLRGEFKDAASSYRQAIAADPRYAPAWRNLGVLEDLYLTEPEQALAAFEQYQQLTNEEKPVSGWIAELRQRLGMPLKRPAPAAPAGEGGAAPPQSAPPQSAPPQAPAAPGPAAPTSHSGAGG